MRYKYKLGVVGFGNMSGAILFGIDSANILKKPQVLVYDTDPKRQNQALTQGYAAAADFAQLSNCEYILLAVKPQSAPEVFRQFDKSFSGCVLMSIMAGISRAAITAATGILQVCRCMPNTPASIGKGVTAIEPSTVQQDKRQFIYEVFQSVGSCIDVEEKLLDAVTAISGSGPAYVYLFIDAYINAAKELGLSAEQARMLVLGTLEGACGMVQGRNQDIPTLIDSVCSKGGTTIEAVNVFKQSDFDSIIHSAVKAAHRRSVELSESAGK